ncbi:POK9 protein, partial [Calcarius ornatus]|nr:POK9 protein [Calcarius ornatus]
GSLGLNVATSVTVTLMTTKPEKAPTRIMGPIIINGQPMGALLLGRSSATMMGLFVLTGVIDADFTGEICVMVYTLFPPIRIEKGQRIAQLVPLEQLTRALPLLQSQSRGEWGFGSTGGLTLLTMNINEQPKCTVIIEFQGERQTLQGLLDTGADSRIIS